MRKRFLFLGILLSLAVIFICAWHFHFFPFKNPYVKIPVKFTFSQIPYVETKIKKQNYFLKIDSGSDFELSIKKDLIKKIARSREEKTTRYNIKGNEYEISKYLIPKIEIGKLQIQNATAHDGYIDGDGHIWGKKEQADIAISGTIGRPLLGITGHLLLDFKNSVFFLVRSNDSLKYIRKEGYSIENMIEVPFEGEKNRIVFSVDTDVGEKKFLLDTGASVSIIRPSFVTDEEREEMRHNMMFMTTSKLLMANHDFGALDLHFYDFSDKFTDIDGILGMDFCQKHVIYLDFKGKRALIGPSEKLHSNK